MALQEQYNTGSGWANLDRTGVLPTINIPYSVMYSLGLQVRQVSEEGCVSSVYQQPFPVLVYDAGTAATIDKATIDSAFSSGYGLVYSGTRYTSKSAWQAAVISGQNPWIITYNDTSGRFEFTRGANVPPTQISMYRPVGVPVNNGTSDMTDAEINAALTSNGITYNSTNYTDLAAFTAAVIANETDIDVYDPSTGEFIETSGSAPAQISVTVTTSTIKVLFIVDYVSSAVTPETRDTALTAILEANGYEITYQGDQIAVAGDAVGKDLILISDRASDANMNGLFSSTAVPVLVMNGDRAVDHGLVGAVASPGNATTIWIDNNSHPITAGKSTGSLTVLTAGTNRLSAIAADIGSGVSLASTDSGGTNKTIVYWDTGVAMDTGNAPAKRAICFITGAGGDRLTSDGEDLFLQACNWLSS